MDFKFTMYSCMYLSTFRLDKQLSEFEKKHEIAVRWSENDHLYTSAKLSHLSELQEEVKSSMWTLVTRRQFLLKLKAKYAGMYNIL